MKIKYLSGGELYSLSFKHHLNTIFQCILFFSPVFLTLYVSVKIKVNLD